MPVVIYFSSAWHPIFYHKEIVPERVGEGKGQRLSAAVHIIDALFLVGVDVRGQGYVERMDKARLMTRSLLKLTYRDLTPVRTKELYQLKAIERVFHQRLVEKQVKGEGKDGMNWLFLFCCFVLLLEGALSAFILSSIVEISSYRFRRSQTMLRVSPPRSRRRVPFDPSAKNRLD